MNELTGSEKQVTWATQIREKMLNSLNTETFERDLVEIKEILNGEKQTKANGRTLDLDEVFSTVNILSEKRAIRDLALQHTEASWWIDNRSNNLNELFPAADEEIRARRESRKEFRNTVNSLEDARLWIAAKGL